jgi:acetyl esterase
MALGFVRRTRFRITIGVIAAAVVSLFLAFRLSPWPGALLIRQVFENDANNVLKEMETHAAANVASILNERCRAGDGDA